MASRIAAAFPSPTRYIEPFLGSGAIFFALRPESAALSDLNGDLITAFQVVRDEVDTLIERLGQISQDPESYYLVRCFTPHCEVDRAVRLIYLSRTAFNGIWRVNRRGDFNVPYGKRPRSDLVDAPGLRDASQALKIAKIEACDFEEALKQAGSGDFVYVDPPYTVRHENNGFRKYNEILFSWEDQERLARAVACAVQRGAGVLVSNARHATIRELYPSFREFPLTRSSCIAADGSARIQVTESLFVSSNLALRESIEGVLCGKGTGHRPERDRTKPSQSSLDLPA